MIAIDLSKQQVLDADPKAIQQTNFTLNIDQTGQTAMYFIIEKAFSENFSKGTVSKL